MIHHEKNIHQIKKRKKENCRYMYPYQKFPIQFSNWNFSKIGNWYKIVSNWIQLDSVGLFSQLILDLIRLDWTPSQLDKIGFNWTFVGEKIFQLEIY